MREYVKTIRQKIGHDMLLLVGASVYVYRDGKVLLQRRKDNGCWAEHGGCVEIGEDVEAAARRELLEETGLTANRLEFFMVTSGEDMLYTYPHGDKVYIVDISYICRDYSGEPTVQASEVQELRWFALDALPDNISPPSRRPLLAFAERMMRPDD